MRYVKPREGQAQRVAILADTWPECVASLLGPSFGKPEIIQLQRLNALRLAAASLVFASESALCEEVLDRISDIADAEKPPVP